MPFTLGDMNDSHAAILTKVSEQLVVTNQMSLNRLDAGAQKSMFEVDANETGLSNANQPRAFGGAVTPGA